MNVDFPKEARTKTTPRHQIRPRQARGSQLNVVFAPANGPVNRGTGDQDISKRWSVNKGFVNVFGSLIRVYEIYCSEDDGKTLNKSYLRTAFPNGTLRGLH